MTYNNTLATATDRIRFAVGDTGTTELLPDATYTAVLEQVANDEGAAVRRIAAALAVQYAQQPTSLYDSGSGMRWGDRVAQWNKLARGEIASGLAARSAKTNIGQITTGTDWTIT